MEPVGRLIDRPDERCCRRFILRAQDYLLERGLTAVSEILSPGSESVFRELDRSGRLVLFVDGWRRVEEWDRTSPPPESGERFRVETLKLFLDGSFGSRTAALEDPYLDDPGDRGMLFYEDGELAGLLSAAGDAGWRVAMHAIGDRAVRQACRAIDSLGWKHRGRFRLEHLQLIPAGFAADLARCGAAASVQPVHLPDDQVWLAARIGPERCRRSFVWRSLLEAGMPLALGSDWPVAPPDPLLNIHIAVNRAGFGEKVRAEFATGEGLDPVSAVRAATYGWAVAAGMEGFRGAIAPGRAADLTLVSGVSPDLADWSEAKIELTVCGGEVFAH